MLVVGLIVGCSGVLVAAVVVVVVVVLAQGGPTQAESAVPPTLLPNSQSTMTETQIKTLPIKQQKKRLPLKKNLDYDLVADMSWKITAIESDFGSQPYSFST